MQDRQQWCEQTETSFVFSPTYKSMHQQMCFVSYVNKYHSTSVCKIDQSEIDKSNPIVFVSCIKNLQTNYACPAQMRFTKRASCVLSDIKNTQPIYVGPTKVKFINRSHFCFVSYKENMQHLCAAQKCQQNRALCCSLSYIKTCNDFM